MEQTKTTQDVFDLGTRVGRKQALGLIAGRCTAAELECLAEVYESKVYLAVESTWEAYCTNRLGISRRTAERALAKAEESLQAAINEFSRLQTMDLDDDFRLRFAMVVETGQRHLEEIRKTTGL